MRFFILRVLLCYNRYNTIVITIIKGDYYEKAS